MQIAPTASGARNHSQCDSMLIGDGAAANTYPYIQVGARVSGWSLSTRLLQCIPACG